VTVGVLETARSAWLQRDRCSPPTASRGEKSVIRSTMLTTRMRTAGAFFRSHDAAASVSSVDASPAHASTTSGSSPPPPGPSVPAHCQTDAPRRAEDDQRPGWRSPSSVVPCRVLDGTDLRDASLQRRGEGARDLHRLVTAHEVHFIPVTFEETADRSVIGAPEHGRSRDLVSVEMEHPTGARAAAARNRCASAGT